MWRFIIWLLRCRDADYFKAVKVGDDSYIISIEKFVPVSEEMKKWKNALAGTRTLD